MNPDKILHRCAWCPAEPIPAGFVVSHGLCPAHYASQMAELELLFPPKVAA